MPKRNGFTPIIILLVILVIVAIAGAFYLGKKNGTVNYVPIPNPVSYTSPSSIPSLSPSSDLTADWKTSSFLDLSFKYPPTWNLVINKAFPVFLQPNNLKVSKNYQA
jgi:hypothetical protein